MQGSGLDVNWFDLVVAFLNSNFNFFHTDIRMADPIGPSSPARYGSILLNIKSMSVN